MISKTLDSIRGNSYRPIEIIVVDDGSTDGTADAVEKWSVENSSHGLSIRTIIQCNSGVSAARNRGLAEATGGYLLFLDSDDLLLPHALVSLADLLEDKQADFAYGRTNQVGRNGKVYATLGKPIGDIVAAIPDHNWHISSLIVRKSLLAESGLFDESLQRSEDWEFAAKVKASSRRFAFSDSIVSTYVIHDGEQLVKSSYSEYAEARERAIRKVHSIIPTAPSVGRELAMRICARLAFGNALRFLRAGDAAGFARTMQIVEEWTKPPHRWMYSVLSIFYRIRYARRS